MAGADPQISSFSCKIPMLALVVVFSGVTCCSGMLGMRERGKEGDQAPRSVKEVKAGSCLQPCLGCGLQNVHVSICFLHEQRLSEQDRHSMVNMSCGSKISQVKHSNFANI